MQNEKSKGQINDTINDFIQKNRVLIFILTGVIVFLLVGSFVFLGVKDSLDKKAILQAEELTNRHDEIIAFLHAEYDNEDVEILLSDIEAFAGNKRGFAASKAWSLAANIYTRKEDWQKTEEAWLKAARAGSKNYLGPIALFQAAVAAEEQGNIDKAIDLLQQCLAHRFEFPAAPRAQFAIGRLYEQLGNDADAVEAYRAVLINWADMPVWPDLARSRIIAIEIK
jgi:tetratricopeptide (TPR) repeat protein